MPKRNKDQSHIARVIALQRARKNGWLEGRPQEEIAARLGVNRSTICRNVADLDEIDQLANEYLELLAPKIPTRK